MGVLRLLRRLLPPSEVLSRCYDETLVILQLYIVSRVYTRVRILLSCMYPRFTLFLVLRTATRRDIESLSPRAPTLFNVFFVSLHPLRLLAHLRKAPEHASTALPVPRHLLFLRQRRIDNSTNVRLQVNWNGAPPTVHISLDLHLPVKFLEVVKRPL